MWAIAHAFEKNYSVEQAREGDSKQHPVGRADLDRSTSSPKSTDGFWRSSSLCLKGDQ